MNIVWFYLFFFSLAPSLPRLPRSLAPSLPRLPRLSHLSCGILKKLKGLKHLLNRQTAINLRKSDI